MKKGILVLLAVMVILASFAFVRAEGANETNQSISLPWISPSLYEEFNKSEWVNVVVFVGSVDLIDSVIANLSESDFQLDYKRMGYLPYFVGNITKKGLAILANNSNVGRIEYNMIAYGASGNSQNKTLPYVDPAILTAFENQTWVEIMIEMRDTTNITISQSDTKEQQTAKKFAKKAVFDSIVDAILSNLTDEEFKLKSRFLSGRQFYGNITKKGFDKISKNSNISQIYLPPPPAHTTIPMAENFVENENAGNGTESELLTKNSIENQTEAKPEIVKPQSIIQRIISFFKALFRWR